MSYVYARGNIWWFRVKDPATKKWLSERTPHKVDDPNGKRKARRVAEATQRKIDARRAVDGTAIAAGPMTVREYARGWVDKRREADLDWVNDESRLRNHVLPVLGDMSIDAVRARHVADLVHRLRHASKLAPHTVYNIYAVVTAMFRDAAIDGAIEQTPCILTKAQLGPLVDADPEWRDQAVFTREEAETLISQAEIPEDRRIYYAFMLLAGMRPGEIAALRWRHYERDAKPLGRITVALALNTRKGTIKGTKTNAVRHVPAHPTLAAMLAEWRLSGWAAIHGRAPESDDLVVPLPPDDAERRRSRSGEPIRPGDYAGKKWRDADLAMLGWREREMYAMKSTFISLCEEDGADAEIIESRVTHTRQKRGAFAGYMRRSDVARANRWAQTCAEVAKLKISRHRIGDRVVALKAVR